MNYIEYGYKETIIRCPILLLLVAFFVTSVGVSCSHSRQNAKIISDAERIVDEYPDSALVLLGAIDVMNDLINSTTAEDEAKERFVYEYEKLDVLIELRKIEESGHRAESPVNACTNESSIPYILVWKSLAKLNMHDFTGSAVELAKADS